MGLQIALGSMAPNLSAPDFWRYALWSKNSSASEFMLMAVSWGLMVSGGAQLNNDGLNNV
jgi:hypothetical protein